MDMQIRFSAFAGTVEEQLNEQGYTLGDHARRIDAAKEATDFLYMHGYMTESERKKACQRIAKDAGKRAKAVE